MSVPVPIVLPQEPPYGRVIEAVDGDGTVVRTFVIEDYFGAWPAVVHIAMGYGWSLRHVAAESGEQS